MGTDRDDDDQPPPPPRPFTPTYQDRPLSHSENPFEDEAGEDERPAERERPDDQRR